jgi:predicted enzyme related to lactoylglutathione lyase
MVPPMDVGAAGRMAVCADPAGARFSLWQAGSHKGAQLVNEPGTWNWSNLNTRDVDGSLRFYASVFNWQSQALDLGHGTSWMLRMPGYAEFLELRIPGLRELHAAAGAPQGFTDAIAWLQPLGDTSAAPPQWSVTFAVADIDATVRQARALGGTVVVEPVDVPYARIAVLRDPGGAEFGVSKYTGP